jgi:hypothetical protein
VLTTCLEVGQKMSTQRLILGSSYRDLEWMESRQHCAFNQTRNSFLSLNVVVGDFSVPSLASWMSNLTPDSDAGLWIAPFRGLPTTNQRLLLDLVYLDANCRVIDLVESFPNFHLSSSNQPAASVLALSSGTISSSDTRLGDSLVICTGDKLTKRQHQAGRAGSRIHAVTGPVQSQGRPSGRTLLIPGVEQSQHEHPSEEPALSIAPQPIESTQVKGSVKIAPPRQGLLARWLLPSSKDRRTVPPTSIDNLVAYFWTGGAPTVNAVRSISSSGLYVVTTERWYPGTLVRMTLTITSAIEEALVASICVYQRVRGRVPCH